MQNPVKCKALLECILGIRIRRIEYPELEKTIDKVLGSKSVRLDVYVEDDANTIYNVEMQATDRKNLPRRMRYYQAMIDINIIDKGQDYNALKRSYVIFICDYDEFGYGRHIYTFENRCREIEGLTFGDETVKIVKNSLDEEVEQVRVSEKWRRKYMTLYLRDRENIALGGYKQLVSLIRDIEENEIALSSKFLKVDEDYIREVQALIREFPDLDDEQIAEKLMY